MLVLEVAGGIVLAFLFIVIGLPLLAGMFIAAWEQSASDRRMMRDYHNRTGTFRDWPRGEEPLGRDDVMLRGGPIAPRFKKGMAVFALLLFRLFCLFALVDALAMVVIAAAYGAWPLALGAACVFGVCAAYFRSVVRARTRLDSAA